MRCESQRAVALLSMLFVATLPCSGRAAGPAKPDTARKGFDYRRPNPAEVLSNPATGMGTPPQLKEYAPTAAMGEASGSAPQGGPDAAPAIAGSRVVSSAPPAAAPPASGAAPGPMAPKATPQAPVAAVASVTAPPPVAAALPSGLQALFAAEITRSGIDGVSPALPASEATADATSQAATERAWSVLARDLRVSSAAWARRLPARTPAALDRVEAVVAPGRITITRAPGRLTGAFEGTPP